MRSSYGARHLFCGFLTVLVGLFLFECKINPYEHGQILYQNFCSNCHMDDGSGLQGIIPPLASSDYVRNNQGLLPCIIYQGMSGKIEVNGTTYDSEMLGTPQLTEFEITNIINYINTAWGNDYPVVQHKMVKEALLKCGYNK